MRDVRERLAEALCWAVHPDLQPTLVPVYDTGDPRNEVAACFACQRATDERLSQRIDALIREGAAEALESFVNGIYLSEGPRYEDRARIVAEGQRRAAALRAASHTEAIR